LHSYIDDDCDCVQGLQKLVQVAAYKEEFARWCDATVKSLHTNINGINAGFLSLHYLDLLKLGKL